MKNIRIVLINTSHPGNIGAVARAMKTMCLSELVLVEPRLFPHQNAYEMASGALDILGQAKVMQTLDEAIADCALIIGTSARSRSVPWPMLSPRECGETVITASRKNKIALLFGREQTGLTNEELQRCHYHVQIPANPEYSSLNIAAAVQVIAYELLVAAQSAQSIPSEWDYEYATCDELEKFYQHLEQVLIKINFLNPKAPRKLMARLRRLYTRAHLDKMEINILRGMLTEIEKSLAK